MNLRTMVTLRADEIEKIWLFMLLLTVALFPKTIHSNFPLRLLCKKIKTKIDPVNYTRQFKLN